MRKKNLILAGLFIVTSMAVMGLLFRGYPVFVFGMFLTGIFNSLYNREGFFYYYLKEALGLANSTSSILYRAVRHLQ